MPHTTVDNVLWKSLKFKNYNYQLLQHVAVQGKAVNCIFYCDFLPRLEDEIFAVQSVFKDKVTFQLSGNFNRHYLRICGSKYPLEVTEHTRDSLCRNRKVSDLSPHLGTYWRNYSCLVWKKRALMSCFPKGRRCSRILQGSDALLLKVEFLLHNTSIFKSKNLKGCRHPNYTNRKQHYTTQKYIMAPLRSSSG
jgi:hypothetical protein